MSYDDARREYEHREPHEAPGRPLTEGQRAALRIVGELLDERGIDCLTATDAPIHMLGSRWIVDVQRNGSDVTAMRREFAQAVEDALTGITEDGDER